MRVVAVEGTEIGVVLEAWELRILATYKSEAGRTAWERATVRYPSKMPKYDAGRSIFLKDALLKAVKVLDEAA